MELDEPDLLDDNDPTTLIGIGLDKLKDIPFGSTAAQRPLRVQIVKGSVSLTLPSGSPLQVDRLPPWERKELLQHIEFALATGSL